MNELSALSAYHWTPAAILTGLGSLVLLAGVILIMRRRARSSSALNRYNALILVSGATLGSLALSYAAPSDAGGAGWAHAAVFFCSWIPALIHATVSTVRRSSRISIPLMLIAAVFSVVGARTTLIVNGFHQFWWGRFPRAEPLSGALVVYWIVMLVLSAILIHRQRRRVSGESTCSRLDELQLIVVVGTVALVDVVAALGVGFPPVGGLAVVALGLRIASSPRIQERLFPVTIETAAEHVVEAMADAVIVLDADGRIVVVNHALESMLGYAAAELRGESLQRLVYLHDEDTTRSDRMRAVLRGRTIRDIERVLRTKNGEPIPVSISMSAMVGGDAGVVLVIRDIRTRKASESEVRRTAALLRSILDSTRDAILVVGADGRLLSWNRRLVELFGVELEALQGLESSAVLETLASRFEDPSAFADAIMRPESPTAEPGPFILGLKDGRQLECSSIPHDLDGDTIGRVWSLDDVTDVRRAEQALRTSERQYRLLFERNAAGVYRAALDGTILDCNDAYARMFGYVRASDLVGANCLGFFFDRDERESLIAMLRDVGSLTGVELRLRRRDGRELWVMENLTVVPSSGLGPVVVEGTLVDISSLKIAEEQMEFQAYHDVLTVLPNRRLFIDRLTLALAHARRTNAALAVMFLDLDHFKNVNDTLGHTAGDELLLAVSERLRLAVREEDTVARIGGDEFTILTAGLREPQDAIVVAEKILVSLSQPVEAGGTELSISASIGIAFYPDDGDDPESLLQSSDNALYRAKELGRNNYQLCTPQLKVRAIERVTVETELRKSMREGGMVVHYQPIVRLDTGEITAVEALVRWNHPVRGLVTPAAFMGVAEESRLSLPLDLWVINEACSRLRDWHGRGASHLTMSVNVSPHHIQQKELPRRIESILAEHSIPPDRLEVELNERAFLEAREASLPVLRELREMGVSIAIDDFGTGYTSMNNLKNLPIDAVKIDGSMVAALPLQSGDAAIVAAIVNVAKRLNLRVVAEGVETAEQVRLLREHRCTLAQGHLFSAALPAPLLEEMVGVTGSGGPKIDVKRILKTKA